MNPDRREIAGRLVLAGLMLPLLSSAASGCGLAMPEGSAAQDETDGVSVRDPRFGAKGDGIADDTKTIQAAIDAAPVVHIPAGTYIVGDSLVVPANRRITGAGATSILRKKDEQVGRLLVNAPGAVTGIVIERLTIDGNRKGTAYVGGKDGLFLTRCVGAVVRDVTVRNCLNDGIIIEYGSGNRVTGCVAQGNAKDGIYSSGGKDIRIDGNRTFGNSVAGIAVVATSGGLVTGNRSRGNRSDIMLGRDSQSIRVIGNDCRSATAFVVSGENIAAQTLNGITYPTQPARGWDWLYGAAFCTLSRNYFGGEVRLILFNDGEVSNNICAGSRSQGLLLQGASRNRIVGNTIRDWGAGFHGIQLASLNAVDAVPASQGLPIRSTDNIVTGNRLSGKSARNAIVNDGARNHLLDNPAAAPA